MTDILGQGCQFPFTFGRVTGATVTSTATSRDQAHIHESIRQILGTHRGERFLRPEFGCRLQELLFEGNDAILQGLVRHEVRDALARWEPRIAVEDVRVTADEHSLSVEVRYHLIASQVEGNLVLPLCTRCRMTTARARLPYLNKDYDAIRADLVARIPQLTDRWTDLNPSDLGIVLLELVAGVGDMLAYYLDAQAAECYLPTARRRQSVIDLCALINYRLHGPVAATTVMRFALAAPLTQAVAIPAGTVLQAIGAGDPIPFETTNDAVLPAGQTGVDVGARQGDRRRELLAGMGAACQRLTLAQTAAHGTLTVAVNGTAWQEVEHFVDSGPADPHYRIALGGLDQTSVIFGDGRQGMAPPAGASIAVSYLVTLGPGGNLAPHLVTTLPSPVLVNGAPAALSVDNPLPATGGAEAESHEHARMLAPAVLRSTWKAVTKADYQALCLAFPGVAKAQVLDTNDDPSLRIYCVRIVVAPAGGDLPSPSLLADLQALLEARRMVTVEVSVEAPVYRPVPVSAVLYAYRGQEAEIVRQRAQAALADHFAFDRQDFGQAVYTSDLIALLDGIAGISHVALQAPAADIALAPRELATLGDVTLTVQEVR